MKVPESQTAPQTLVEELLEADGPAETTVHRVPTADQSVPVADYPDWTVFNTRIVTCRIANDLYKDERFETRDEALAAMKVRYGRVLEANYVPGRAFFRVPASYIRKAQP